MAGEATPLAAEIIDYLRDSGRLIVVAAEDLGDVQPKLDQDTLLFVHGIEGAVALAGIPEAVVTLDRQDLNENWLAEQLAELTARRSQKLSGLGRFATHHTDLSIEIFATARRTNPYSYVPANTNYHFRQFVIMGGGSSLIPSLRRTGLSVVPHMQNVAATTNHFTTYMDGDPRQHIRENLYPS